METAGTPLTYEVCIGEDGSGECVMVGSDRELIIDGIGVASSEEEVSVTAINLAGLRSTPVRGRVVFQTLPPQDTGELSVREGGRRKGGGDRRCSLA